MKPMELYIANVPFDDEPQSKWRPALIIEASSDFVLVLKITTKYQSKSTMIQNLYYPIKEWRAAGLKRQSYVDVHRFYRLPIRSALSRKPIGKLTLIDVFGLQEFRHH